MELDWNHRQVSEYSANSLSGGPAPRGCHLVTTQQEGSSVFGPWDIPLLLFFPCNRPPRTQLCKGKGKGAGLCSQRLGTWKKGAQYTPRSGSCWAAGRGGAVCYHYLPPQQCLLITSALSPIGLASVAGRGDRKPIPRTNLLSLSGAVTDLGVPEKLHSLLL